MTLNNKTYSFDQRVGLQFYDLIELSESLTIRLIELEEKINLLEANLPLKEFTLEERNKQLLLDTEKRLRNLQILLNQTKQ